MRAFLSALVGLVLVLAMLAGAPVWAADPGSKPSTATAPPGTRPSASAATREAAKEAYTKALRLLATCHVPEAKKELARAAKLDPAMPDFGAMLAAAELRCSGRWGSTVFAPVPSTPDRGSGLCAGGASAGPTYRLTDGRTVSVSDGVYSDGTVDPESTRHLRGVASGCGGSGSRSPGYKSTRHVPGAPKLGQTLSF